MKQTKKFAAGIAGLFLLLFTHPISAATPLPYDFNEDGKTDSQDAVYLYQHIQAPETYPLSVSGDSNGDGQISEDDVLYLVRHVLSPDRYPLIADTSLQLQLTADGTAYSVVGLEDSAAKEVVVPDTYNDLPIVSVSALAFSNNQTLTSVTLGKNIQSIDSLSFYNCNNLSKVYILNEDIRSVSPSMIYLCDNLNTVFFAGTPPTWHEFDIYLEAQTDIVFHHGHEYTSVIIEPPSCTMPGVVQYTCSHCDRTYQDTLPKLGHAITEGSRTPPTCTQNGTTVGICSVCGETSAVTVPALGHTFGVTIQNKAPSCTEPGQETRLCSTCHEEVVISLPMTGHTPGPFTQSGDFCGENAVGSSCCTTCGEEIFAVGHQLVTSITHADCHTDGTKITYCVKCDYSTTETIPSPGHIPGRETLTTAPTCTDEGEKTVSCLVCGECLSSTSVPTIDHTLTMTVTGTTAVYRCVQCDYSYSIDTSGTYCITFDTLGGTPLANLYVPEGVSPVLPTPVYEGYEFLGWFKDDTLTIPYEAEAIGGDITLYAQWAPEYISASANTGNSFRDATTSFVFTVISSIPLTDSNLNEYVQVLNSAKEEMDIYIQASAGNRYTIAGHYSEGDIYHATVHDSLKIDGTDEHKIWFVIDGQRREDVVIHKDVTVLSHEEVSGLFHQDGKTYLFLDQNKLSVGDKVLVCGQTATDFECAVLVTDAGMFGEYYLYECVAAEPDEIFEKIDIFYNDTLDLSGIDLTTLEEELMSSLYESDLYHAVHEAGRQYAITKSYADMKYYYDFNGFKLTKFAVSVEDADEDDEDGSEIKDTQQKLIVTFELSTAFSRLDTQTREVVDYIKLSVGMDLSATFYASIALREDGRLMKSLTRGNFEIIVGSERETDLYFTVSASDDLDFAKEKDYFKELVKLELAKDKNKGVDSAPAKDSNTKELCDISVGFYGFHFGIRLVNTFDFSIAAELGVDLYNSSVEEVIFSARNWNITTASHSGESTRMSVYLAGKIEVSDTIGLYVYVDFLRLAELNVSIHPGLYFEMGGLVSITWENWSETNKIFAGYVEAGLIVKVRGGYKVNILVKKFEDEIDFLEKRFILFSAGERELPLYFQYPEETFELQANLGEKISLVDKHDKTVVVQDLILLDKITKEAKKFTYSLHSGGKYATVSSSGVLTVIGCDENNLAEIVVKITSDTISKYVTYRISVPGHEHTFESTLTSSVSCVTDTVYHRECTSCAFYFDETTEEAWGHSGEWVVIQETTCTITGYSDRVCDVCGHIDRKFERRFNHDYTAQIPTTAYLKKAATCQKQAEYYYACQNCGGRDTRFFYLYGDLGDHAYADPYTCHDRPCLTEECTYTCPATTGHNFTDWLEQEPLGCMANEDPFFVRCCKDCRFFEPNQSQTWHHDLAFGELSAPTCTEEGILSSVYCTKCDYVDPFPHTAPALGHDMVYIYDPEINGHIYTCQRFGCDLEERFAEHTWVVVREATCTTPGIRSIHCTLCGYSATEDIPALEHLLRQQEAKEPSCLSVGWNAHVSCSRCSYTTKVEIPALNHIPGGWQGTRDTGHSIRCQRPGCHSVLAQEAHSYGDWIIQTQPSCCGTPGGASGTKYKECSVCGYQEFGTIPAPDCIPGPAATCTSPQICTVCGSRISDALGHRPSWISDGTDMHHWYCSNPGCDYTGDAEPHAFGDWTVNSSPTCVNDGLKTRTCRLCQHSESESIPKKAHTYISVPAAPPSCVNDGWGAYQYCQQCGDSTQLTIAALGHTYGEWQIDEEKGVHYQYCTNDLCDSGVGHRFNAAAHTYGAWSTYKEASCTVDGEERRECTVCFSHEARPIEANHKPGPVATCYAPQICTLCQIELVPATDHDIHYVSDGDTGHYTVCRNANCDYKGSTEAHTYENVLYEAPTCAKEGKNVQKCVVCAYTATTILDKTDHTLIAIEAKAPSCQEGGWNAYVKCTNEGCSYSTYEDNKLSSLGGHLWGEWQYTESAHSRFCTRDACQGEDTHTPAYGNPTVVAPKCLEDGYTRHSCTHTGCGYFYDDSPTQQLGHKLKDMDGMDPTCTEAGYVMYVICTRSGCDFNTKSEIPALGHDFDTTWYSENPSTHYYPCTREGCDAKEREETHTWSDWTIITAATCTEDGVQTKSCLVCERTETQNISAPGHTPAKAGLCTDDILCTVCGEIVTPGKDHEGFVKVVTDPTCTEGGFTTYTCRAAHCGYQYVDSYTNPLSHKPADTYTVSEDTLYHYHACLNNCGTELDIAEHTFTDWVITSNPACVKEGVQEKVCVDCSHKATQSIPPTGHSLYLDTESKRLPNTEEGIIRYEISIVELCHNCTYRNVLASSIEHGHGSTVTTAGKPASCTEDGYYEAVYCAFPECGELLLPYTVIPALGHEYKNGYCIRCGSGKPTASEGLTFTLSDDGTYYIVSGIGTCTDTEIVIPDTHEGLPVKEIGNSAFLDCTDIVSVSIPNSVTSIGLCAFYGCSGLTSISIPNSVTSIGDAAFYGCSGLTSIIIPNSVTTIGGDAFCGCTGLTSITIPNSVTSIGDHAFYGCTGLTSITISNSVTSIGNYAFCGCTGLTSITIPNSVTSIGEIAFYYCTGLTSITIPNSVTSIGDEAFSSCSNLAVIYYTGTPSQWEAIQKGAMWNANTQITADSIYYYSETEPDYSTGLTYWHYVDGEIVLWEKNELIASEGLAFTLSDDGKYYIVSGIGTCTDTEIVIPDTHEGLPVREIGSGAFENCSNVTSMYVPKRITFIGKAAFYKCSGLSRVILPDSITSVSRYTFGMNDALRAIHYKGTPAQWEALPKDTIWNSNTHITANSIYYYSEAEPDYSTGHTYWHYVDGEIVLWGDTGIASQGLAFTLSGDGTYYIVSGIGTCTDTDIVIPDTHEGLPVKEIGNSAFFNLLEITSVSIPASVTSIGDEAFYACYSLTSVQIPEGVVSIGNSVFESCSALESITIPNSVTSMGWRAFAGCESASSLSIGTGIASISNYTFDGCTSLVSVVVPDNVTSIGDGVFCGCTGLTSITLPANITWITCRTFDGCSNLTSVTIGSAVNTIAAEAFMNCSSLASIVIPDSVTFIGDNSFEKCSNLSTIYYKGTPTQWNNITICDSWNTDTPLTADSIYYYSEAEPDYSTGHTYWHYVDGEIVLWEKAEVASQGLAFTLSGDGTYYIVSGIGTCTDTEIVIPDSHEGLPVKEIGDSAFYCCTGLTSITIPNSVTSIGSSAFSNCTGLTSITLPNSVTSIGDEAFYACYSLTSVQIPNSVTSIGSAAFCGCTSLSSITIPEGVTSISDNTFAYCTSLTSITLPDSITSIDDFAFYECTSLTSITLPDGITHIGKDAFYGCRSLTSIAIPRGITYIEFGWFDGCTGLTSVTIPESVTSISDFAFSDCPNITSITVSAGNPVFHSDGNCLIATKSKTLIFGCSTSVIPSDGSVTFIGWGAFCGCTELASIIIPGEVTGISSYAFSGCSNLTSITLPDTITSIGWGAFEGCTSLTRINLPRGITDIDGYLFYGCSNLTSITIPENVTKIGNSAFYDCSGLTSITIPEGVTYIGDAAFSCCTDLTSISIPDKVTSIGDSAFIRCSSLTSVTIPESVTVIGEGAFAWCSNLTSITVSANNPVYHSNGNCLIETGSKTLLRGCSTSVIPSDGSVTVIGDRAFSGCSGLASVTIPNSVTYIDDWAFSGCSGLASVTIPNSVTSIGDWAFSDCPNITSITVSAGNPVYHSNGNCLIETGSKTLLRGCSTSVIPSDGSVTMIGDFAFSGCSDLASVTIPNSVTYIGYGAFQDCAGLTSIIIPNSVTFIDYGTFSGCSDLASVTIPNSVTYIGDAAFFNCTSLTTIHYTGTMEQWSAITKVTDWNANTPSYTVVCTDGTITKQ